MKKVIFLFFFMSFAPLTPLLSQILEDKTDSTKAQKENFMISPETASFPGGISAWQKHLRKSIKSLQPPCESGKVFVTFKVLASGKLDSILVIKGLCEMADQNVIEIVKTSGQWQPEYRNGKPIDSRIGLQIYFRYRK